MAKAKKKNPSPGILDWLVDPLKGLFSPLKNILRAAVSDLIKHDIKEIEDQLKKLGEESKARLAAPIETKSPLTFEDADKAAAEITEKSYSAFDATARAMLVTSALPFVDIETALSFAYTKPFYAAEKYIATEYCKKRWTYGLEPFLRRGYNAKYRPTLPGVQDLPPMLWRQLITEDKAIKILAQQGFSTEFVAAYIDLAKQIPGYQDLITLMVREIITPDDFIKWIGRQGYSPYWASALYDAHFRLPSPEHIYDAFHRGLISEAELDKYIFWHDYQPTPRPDISKTDLAIMRGLTKTLIPRVDLRRAWLQGEITDEELTNRYGWLGYEDDAALMARIQKAVALTPQRNTVRNMFLRGLRKGVYSEAVVRARLKELRYPGAAVDLLIEAENVRREIGAVEIGEEPRILSTSQITAAYKKRLITREAAEAMLAAQGWDPGAADMLLMLSEPVPEKVDQLTAVKTAAATLYREGYMSVEEFEGHLRAANYNDEDIARIRLAEDLRYRWDFLKDLQAADVEAYRKDVLTLEELAAGLLERDLQPERAAALLAKEAYKKLPKPKPA